MSPVRVTLGRSVGMASTLHATALTIGCFLAVAAALFSFGLEDAEGGRLSAVAVWAVGVAPILPALAAFLAMDVWSDERRTGRVDLLLSVAVRERDYVLGKFAGVWLMMAFAVGVSLVSSLGLLWYFAPGAFTGMRLVDVLAALLALAVQGTLWCAASVAFSAMFSHAAAAACTSLVVLVALPRGLWLGFVSWAEEGRTAFGEMMLDAHVIDMVSGSMSVGTLLCYAVLTLFALFVATKCVASLRFVGRGSRGLRVSTSIAVLLSLVLAVLCVDSLSKLRLTVDLPLSGVSPGLSPRTRSILTEVGGNVTVTCFLPRSDARFHEIGRFLRRLKHESEAVGGVGIELRFVDPRWDFGAAERLVRRGIAEDSLVFEKGRRLTSIAVRDGCGERMCASAIRNVSMPSQRRKVYWTVGHGEASHDAYGALGMSDVARELSREGFQNAALDLTTATQVPGDCALVIVAGARNDFSRVELGRIDAYLREGGRLLALLDSAKTGGVVSMLPSWGIRPAERPIPNATTLSGTDVVVSGFTDHSVSAPLKGGRLVFEGPVTFIPSAVAETGTGADRLAYSPLAEVGSLAVAAAVERGIGVGNDLALRPTRVVAVGDAEFAMNGQLAAQANANRDFFVNCVSYLSGSDALGHGGVEPGVFSSGLDRQGRKRYMLGSAAVVPVACYLLLAFLAFRRRHRK